MHSKQYVHISLYILWENQNIDKFDEIRYIKAIIRSLYLVKSSHSTDLWCIYTLKEYTEYYKNRGTTVFVTFLDASKAFGRLNYWLLFEKLVKKCVPLYIIKLLCFWYTHHKMDFSTYFYYCCE